MDEKKGRLKIQCIPSGDAALILKAGDDISPGTNAVVRKLLHVLDHEKTDGVSDLLPSYNELMVCYDPLESNLAEMNRRLQELAETMADLELPPPGRVSIPVAYGGEFGPDLEEVAVRNGLSPEEVVRIHSAADYLVYMLGFTPGFCYLGGMDSRIATPRKESPRLKIPAGAVGIAGNQTGVYPSPSPGGWQLIGQTPLKMFEPGRKEPFLVQQGDLVRFEPVSADRFREMQYAADNESASRSASGSGDGPGLSEPGPGDSKPGSIAIEKGGLLSTVQDLGRHGYQRYGMPVSGAMDRQALRLANLLVGNDPGAAGIEATLAGPTMRFLVPTRIALCGSGMQGMRNGSPLPCNEAVDMLEGDLLHFEPQPWGCRMYIAIAGGLDVPMVMGSRSTYLRGGIGGFSGRALRSGDLLALGKANLQAAGWRDRIPGYQSKAPIRIVPGPEVSHLASKGVISLLSTEYRVGEHSDRMGYRLEGEPVRLKTSSADIISAGIAMGTIQVTGSGQPIILMADRQTTGGYARVAVVASVDLGRVAQLRPGDSITFEEISPEEAQKLLRNNNMFNNIK